MALGESAIVPSFSCSIQPKPGPVRHELGFLRGVMILSKSCSKPSDELDALEGKAQVPLGLPEVTDDGLSASDLTKYATLSVVK